MARLNQRFRWSFFLLLVITFLFTPCDVRGFVPPSDAFCGDLVNLVPDDFSGDFVLVSTDILEGEPD